MTTLTTNIQAAEPPGDAGETFDADQVVKIRGVGWAGYKAISRLRREKGRPKLIYIDGDLILVSPGRPHERMNFRLGTLVDEIFVTLRIHGMSLDQTTWRRRRKTVGVEGDHTLYMTNEHLVRGKQVDLRVDPPPDLAIEVVYSNRAYRSLEVYGRLGVPEVWVCDENRVAILARRADGEYEEVEHSRALPYLSAAEVFAQVQQPDGMADLDWIDGVRRWVREVLVPRVPPA